MVHFQGTDFVATVVELPTSLESVVSFVVTGDCPVLALSSLRLTGEKMGCSALRLTVRRMGCQRRQVLVLRQFLQNYFPQLRHRKVLLERELLHSC